MTLFSGWHRLGSHAAMELASNRRSG